MDSAPLIFNKLSDRNLSASGLQQPRLAVYDIDDMPEWLFKTALGHCSWFYKFN